MPPRSRQRSSHVRTGCLTCKHRKVKCSEERPHCGRCTQGNFVCAGYQPPPKTWIFHGSSVAQKHADKIRTEVCYDKLLTSSHNLQTLPSSSGQRFATLPSVPAHLSLHHGNSDPFNTYAIPIGPHETRALQIFQGLVAPRRSSKSTNDVVHLVRECYLNGLKDKATAYALFARDIVLEELMRNGHYAALSTSSLDYMIKSQAALRQRLLLLSNGAGTPHTLYTVMWTVTYLAATDIITGAPTAQFHIGALQKLVRNYARLAGDKMEVTAISSMIAIDNTKAFVASTKPVLDLDQWSHHMFQDIRNVEVLSILRRHSSDSSTNTLHRAIQNQILRTVILNMRENLAFCHSSGEADLDSDQVKILRATLRCRELYQHHRLLHIVADALECLATPALSPEQVQDQCAQIYLSFSVHLWSQIASPSIIPLNSPYDLTSIILHRLKSIIEKSRNDEKMCLYRRRHQLEARLWALFVGVLTELTRQEILDTNLVCGDWYFEVFRHEANSMRVHSWKHAVTIFEQFLYSEKTEPHISQWWHRVSPNEILMTTGQVDDNEPQTGRDG